MKTFGQIACEAVSGPDGWDALANLPAVRGMWETAAMAVAAAEREACAKVCDDRSSLHMNPPIDGPEFIAGYMQEEAEACASRIRARSNAP